MWRSVVVVAVVSLCGACRTAGGPSDQWLAVDADPDRDRSPTENAEAGPDRYVRDGLSPSPDARPSSVPGAITAADATAFMRAMVALFDKLHIRKDGSVYDGTPYEYADPTTGKWYVNEGQDLVHDGAWFMTALAAAHHVTGDPLYRATLDDHLLPYYVRLLTRGKELLPVPAGKQRLISWNVVATNQAPDNGFVPFWWDDGKAASPVTGSPMIGISAATSTHMALDIGIGLALAATVVKPPELAVAAENMRAWFKRENFTIPNLDLAVTLARGGDPSGIAAFSQFPVDKPYYGALAKGGSYTAPGFMDDEEWRFFMAAAQGRGIPVKGAAVSTIYQVWGARLLWSLFLDGAPRVPGYELTEAGLPLGKLAGGRFTTQRASVLDNPLGVRQGPHLLKMEARALALLVKYPGAYDAAMRALAERSQAVPYVFPKVDAGLGLPQGQVHLTPITVGASHLGFASDHKALYLASAAPLTLVVRTLPGVAGQSGTIVFENDGSARAVNAAGEALVSQPCRGELAGKSLACVRIPYSVAREQTKAWANGGEAIALELGTGGETLRLLLATSETNLRDALEGEVQGGLRYWMGIWKEHGFIPFRAGRFDRLSESGALAHLVSLSAEYVGLLRGSPFWWETAFRR